MRTSVKTAKSRMAGAFKNLEKKEAKDLYDNKNLRCDRCGAHALFLAERWTDGSLDGMLRFCGHHGRRHSEALIQSGWSVMDYSHLMAS